MKSFSVPIVFLTASLLLFACSNRKEQIPYEELQITELFNLFINTNDSLEKQKLIQHLDDSIVKYPYGMFYPNESIDTSTNEVSFQLVFDRNLHDDFGCFKIKHRNIFSVNIDRNNQLSTRRQDTLEISSIKTRLKEFLQNKHDSEELPEKRIEFIPFLDTVQVSKGALIIKSNLIPDSLQNRTDWHIIKKVIHISRSSILEIRNETALTHFNKPYQEVSLQEKWALSQYHPIGIWFYPNAYRPKPPPPPILSPKILEILEETEDEEEFELLYEIVE